MEAGEVRHSKLKPETRNPRGPHNRAMEVREAEALNQTRNPKPETRSPTKAQGLTPGTDRQVRAMEVRQAEAREMEQMDGARSARPSAEAKEWAAHEGDLLRRLQTEIKGARAARSATAARPAAGAGRAARPSAAAAHPTDKLAEVRPSGVQARRNALKLLTLHPNP